MLEPTIALFHTIGASSEIIQQICSIPFEVDVKELHWLENQKAIRHTDVIIVLANPAEVHQYDSDITRLKLAKNTPYILISTDIYSSNPGLNLQTPPDSLFFPPFNTKNLEAAVSLNLFKLQQEIESASYIKVQKNNENIKILSSELVSAESYANYIRITDYLGNEYMLRESLKAFCSANSDFMRVHKSFAINQVYIKKISKTIVTTSLGDVPIGRKFRDKVV